MSVPIIHWSARYVATPYRSNLSCSHSTGSRSRSGYVSLHKTTSRVTNSRLLGGHRRYCLPVRSLPLIFVMFSANCRVQYDSPRGLGDWIPPHTNHGRLCRRLGSIVRHPHRGRAVLLSQARKIGLQKVCRLIDRTTLFIPLSNVLDKYHQHGQLGRPSCHLCSSTGRAHCVRYRSWLGLLRDSY